MLGIIFEIALRLRDWYVFIWQLQEILNVSNTLTLKKIENHFQEAGVFFSFGVCFLAKSPQIENIIYWYKTALSEANLKINGMGREFCPITTLFFFNILFQFKNLLKSWFDVPTTQMSIFILFISAGVSFEWIFSLCL